MQSQRSIRDKLRSQAVLRESMYRGRSGVSEHTACSQQVPIALTATALHLLEHARAGMNVAKGSLAKLKTRLGERAAGEAPQQSQNLRLLQQAAARGPDTPVLSPTAQQADREAKQALLQVGGRQ